MTSRRQLLTFGAVTAATVATTSACFGDSTPANTGGNVNQNAGNVNDLQDQEEKLTITPFNRVKTIPSQQYPATLITDSLELRNQREKLLRFNQPDKPGWVYLFTLAGQLIAEFEIRGKVSSTQSTMTTSTGIYKDTNGSTGICNIPVEVPGDDLSYGPNEGGDAGKFFFTADGVLVFWDGPLLYLDAPLKVLQQPAVVQYNQGNSKPSSTAPKA